MLADLMAVAGFMWKGPTRRLSPESGDESMLGVKSVACCRSFPGLSLCMSVRGYLYEAYTCAITKLRITPLSVPEKAIVGSGSLKAGDTMLQLDTCSGVCCHGSQRAIRQAKRSRPHLHGFICLGVEALPGSIELDLPPVCHQPLLKAPA